MQSRSALHSFVYVYFFIPQSLKVVQALKTKLKFSQINVAAKGKKFKNKSLHLNLSVN